MKLYLVKYEQTRSDGFRLRSLFVEADSIQAAKDFAVKYAQSIATSPVNIISCEAN